MLAVQDLHRPAVPLATATFQLLGMFRSSVAIPYVLNEAGRVNVSVNIGICQRDAHSLVDETIGENPHV